MKQMIRLFSLIICVTLCSCVANRLTKQAHNSILAISVKSFGSGMYGYGIEITLVDINTQQSYTSKPFYGFSPHCVIQNLPPGEYFVKKISVPVGNIKYVNWSDSIRAFFGEIKIEPDSKYYLGNFEGKREIGRKDIFRLKIMDQNIPDKVREKIEAEDTGWKNGDFIKLYPYRKDELLVY